MSSPSKDFGPIRADYAFFEGHATEADEDARAYAPHVKSLAATGEVRMLDFGCGEGRLTARLLETVGFPAHRLRLSVVEPDEVYRQEAVRRLQSLTVHPIAAWPELPPGLDARLDLVLSNHVFYYVPNLADVVVALHGALAPGGLFLASIAGQRNTLNQFWNHGFELIGQPLPYHTAEDFEAALVRQRMSYFKEDVQYELAFPDSEANRLTILRFLFGSYFADLPRAPMVELFNDYASQGNIEMRLVHEHFVIHRPSAL